MLLYWTKQQKFHSYTHTHSTYKKYTRTQTAYYLYKITKPKTNSCLSFCFYINSIFHHDDECGNNFSFIFICSTKRTLTQMHFAVGTRHTEQCKENNYESVCICVWLKKWMEEEMRRKEKKKEIEWVSERTKWVPVSSKRNVKRSRQISTSLYEFYAFNYVFVFYCKNHAFLNDLYCLVVCNLLHLWCMHLDTILSLSLSIAFSDFMWSCVPSSSFFFSSTFFLSLLMFIHLSEVQIHVMFLSSAYVVLAVCICCVEKGINSE